MSLTVLKRKAGTKYGGLSSRGNVGFSLNNPRRVDSHRNQVQTQTPMKGNVPRGHGTCCGQYKVVINKSQYANFDNMTRTFVGNQGISVKNYQGGISTRFKWMKRGYPHFVVKNTTVNDASTYITNKANTAICSNFAEDAESQDSCVGNPGCKKAVSTTIVKNVNILSQSEYLAGRFRRKNCIDDANMPESMKTSPLPVSGACNSNCSSS